ncbi:hypothetical protein AAFF_G00273670 [Aldrovandia affinis]|uniref:Uncharacterized protein n=1 Tax=Aldrovandia affinis TaxID=143900 RepID=A0AAD7SRL6_9TELE|nr:hypothetical protein AAFF_G00273670 [Aldrovandia affinis]
MSGDFSRPVGRRKCQQASGRTRACCHWGGVTAPGRRGERSGEMRWACQEGRSPRDGQQPRLRPSLHHGSSSARIGNTFLCVLNKIILDPLTFSEARFRPSLEERLESIISGAALMADSSCTRDDRRERIVAECNAVRQALQDLLSEYMNNRHSFTFRTHALCSCGWCGSCDVPYGKRFWNILAQYRYAGPDPADLSVTADVFVWRFVDAVLRALTALPLGSALTHPPTPLHNNQ